jgi:hypothetical protein
MPYVPSPDETRRLRKAIDRAAFTEGERIFWLFAFIALLALDGVLLAGGTWVGLAGTLGGSLLLYWRLRGGHLLIAEPDRDDPPLDRELHGLGLRTRAQRAYTALMLRQVFAGRNPLRARPEHDPFAKWGERVDRAQVSEEAASE